MGCSFYSQDFGRFIPFFSSGDFIGKGIFLFVQGCVEGGSQNMKYLITSLSLGNVLEEGIQGVVLVEGGRAIVLDKRSEVACQAQESYQV